MNKLLHAIPVLFFLVLNFSFATSTFLGIPLLPGLALAWIFHWTLYRPQQFMSLMLVFVGAVYDLILDNPIGFTPVLYLVSHLIFTFLRSYAYEFPFILIWASFVVYSVVYGIFYWLLACLMVNHWVFPFYTFYSLALAIVVYPFLSRAMISLQRKCYG